MHWPLESGCVPHDELGEVKCIYLATCGPTADPTMVWGTTVDMTGMTQYVRECNRDGSVLISAAHVLLAAVGRSIAQHCCMQRRVVGRRVHRFKRVSVLMPSRQMRHGQVELMLLEDVDQRSPRRIGASTLETQLRRRIAVKAATASNIARAVGTKTSPGLSLSQVVGDPFHVAVQFLAHQLQQHIRERLVSKTAGRRRSGQLLRFQWSPTAHIL